MFRVRKVKPAISVSILLLALGFLSTIDVYAYFNFPHHDTRKTRVDSLFAAWDRSDTPGWTVGIIKNGEIIYQPCFGMADVEEEIPITSETQFSIASMSKQVTAACIALLASRGEISLDDDIHTYVPELPDYGSTITIRHLVHMMSGLIDFKPEAVSQWGQGERFGGAFDNQDALDIILQLDSLTFEPGTMFTYCNGNYVLLVEIVERVSGQTISEFAEENIFGPLGMNHTFYKNDTSPISNCATEYHRSFVDSAYTYWPYNGEDFEYRYNYIVCGNSGVVTTIEDLYRWDQNFYSQKLDRSGKFYNLFLSTGKFDNGEDVVIPWGPYALGIMNTHLYGFGLMHTEYNGSKTIFHPGYVGGFQSIMVRFPEDELAVILMANYEINEATENFWNVMQVANIYLYGEEPTGCDINQDSKLSMKDVIAFLLLAHSDPSDPRLDWNNDGEYNIFDVTHLLRDIWTGNCPEDVAGSTLLASDSRQAYDINVDELNEEQIAYLEKMMDKLDLTEEQEAEIRLVLYGETGAARLPKAYSLEQNSPNPFNPSTTISYTVPEENRDFVTMKVYDLRGRLVRTLIDKIAEAGSYSVFWDGTDESGCKVASGVYLYRMKAGDFVQTRKMVILK
jgi:CubicO group peptidase (beta-lactamase class C family)